MTTKREGLVEFKCNKNVFYNPAMATNRDLSIAVIDTFGKEYLQKYKKKLSIFEGLSASGIRSCRYLNELTPSIINFIHCNDIDIEACKQIKYNLSLNNNLYNLSNGDITISNQDCNTILESHSKSEYEQFTVVDIDPYGTAVPFLNASFKGIKDNGLLCVTCTDLSILCGNDIINISE